jgi:hypothetical protein
VHPSKIAMPLKTDDTFNKGGTKNTLHMALDSLSIGQFEELKSLETSSKQKRFKFLYTIKGLINPIVDLIELTNEKASANADLVTFLKGARVTYLRQLTIQI